MTWQGDHEIQLMKIVSRKILHDEFLHDDKKRLFDKKLENFYNEHRIFISIESA